VNQPVTVTINPRGIITSVVVPDKTLESLRQMPGYVEGRQAFSVESIRELFQSAGTELPEKNIAVGESWVSKRPFTIGSPHQFTRETTYTLQDDGKVNVRSRLVLNGLQGGQRDAATEFDTWAIEDQKSTGSLAFDIADGYCRESSAETMLKTRTQYQGMKVATTITSRLRTQTERK
jgi:hypothetical protein